MTEILLGAVVYLAAAVISAPLAKRLGVSSVLGFLVAGAIIGPSVLDIAGDAEAIMHVAEFGVIVMLFLVGLELEPSKLWQMRRQIFGLGITQVVCVVAVIFAAALPFVGGWREAVAIGAVLVISSTAIVLQALEEKGLLRTPTGRSIFSVLLFEDISVIPILALLPLIAIAAASHGGDHGHGASLISGYPVWAQALLTIGAVALLLLMGRYLMRPLFRLVADTGSREIFVAFALLLVVAITLLMGLVGLSPALGAFLAGVVLADSEYRHELEMDLQPFKGLLLATFFITVGAGIPFALLAGMPLVIAAAVAAYVTLKVATSLAVGWLFGLRRAELLRYALYLGQGSEFGFVLIAFAAGLGLIAGDTPAILTAVIALSMAVAPLLIMLDDKVIQPRQAAGSNQREADAISHDGVDAIIAGHGRFGMTIGRVLNAHGMRTTVLDIDSSQVDNLRKFGFKVFYGDALRMDLLEAAGAREARLLVIAIDDKDKIIELVRIAKHNYPNLMLLVRAYDRAHAYEVIREGADNVYREVFGSSLDVARDALVALGRHPYEAERAVRFFRKFDEKMLRKSATHAGDQAKLIDLANQSRAEIARVFAADQGGERPILDDAWFDEDGQRTIEQRVQ